MSDSKDPPRIYYMPGMRLNNGGYYPWMILGDVLGVYPPDNFWEHTWTFYKSAMATKLLYQSRKDRYNLSILYEQLLDIFFACYLLAIEKKILLNDSNPKGITSPHFPTWRSFKYDPWDVLCVIFEKNKLDDLRAGWWRAYKAAILNKLEYHNRSERYTMTSLFERINDLLTAAYVITQEYEQLEETDEADGAELPVYYPPIPARTDS